MSLFVAFILSAVLIGAGAMLAPVFSTAQPRVGLASTLALALVVSGGILWTGFVGWDTLVIDYLLFGLVSLVVLGGTMVQAGQTATDNEPVESNMKWMSRNDFLFLLILAPVCSISLFFPPQFLENDLMITTGQTLPEIESIFPHLNQPGATGFYILSAYLSQQLKQDMAIVYPAVISVLMMLLVLSAYDAGAELRDTVTGRLFATGALILLMTGYFLVPGFASGLMNLLFSLACLIFALRTIQYRQPRDIVAMVFLFLTIVTMI